jgi:ParB-like chromosome segregation protein Spo0J
MQRMKDADMLETKRALEAKIAAGQPAPTPAPTVLPLRSIREEPELFQHRDPHRWDREKHIGALRKALAEGVILDPVVVMWDGEGYVCVDGHHRLDAYRAEKRDLPVPVTTVPPDVEAAMARAARANTRTSLQMRKDEKLRTAWRLTVGTGLSRSRVVLAAGVASGTVGNMRAVRDTLKAQGTGPEELAKMTWSAARRKATGGKFEEDEWDEAREDAEVQAITSDLVRLFGSTCPKHKRLLFLRAVERWDAQLPTLAREEWASMLAYGSDDEDEEPGGTNF